MQINSIIVVIGPPCVGKGTICHQLQSYNNTFHHISVGALFRKYYDQNHPIRHRINNGELIELSATTSLIKNSIHTNKLCILDGFPRNMEQLNWLITNIQISKYILLSASRSVLQDRMLNRYICAKCEISYSSGDVLCCSIKVIKRKDDNIAVYQRRYDTFYNNWKKMQSIINSTGKLIIINTDNKSIDDVYETVKLHL